MHYPGLYRPFYPDSIQTITSTNNPEGIKPARGSLLLEEIKKYGAEGIVYLNFLTDELVVTIVGLPTLEFFQSSQYLAFIKCKDREEYFAIQLTNTHDDFWIGRSKLDQPLDSFEEIIISSASDQELKILAPVRSKSILIGNFTNISFPS